MMMAPRFFTGANTADRVPMTTEACPSRTRFHSSYRSPVGKQL